MGKFKVREEYNLYFRALSGEKLVRIVAVPKNVYVVQVMFN